MSENIRRLMNQIGTQAKQASQVLATASTDAKNKALACSAQLIRDCEALILQANDQDVDLKSESGSSAAMLDRLRLDRNRIDSIASSLEAIAGLEDPVGSTISEWTRPNGLNISQVRTPLGVIGVIYESRPNVTADAGALCLKSGNAVILRGGSDSFHSSTAIHNCLKRGLAEANLPEHAIQLVPTTDRQAVGELLSGLNGNLDVVVPRGGKSLVARVQSESRVPVFAHLEGICHVYIHHSADPEIAGPVVLNSKLRRTGICGAVETLLVDKDWPSKHLLDLLTNLQQQGCEIRGCSNLLSQLPNATQAAESDWSTEYLEAILSVKIVDGLDAAISHIRHYGSGHTESIIASDSEAATRFLNELDSAILMHNASTQFADGGEFGMGAEIGIATGKMHARGPVGVQQLTSFKYQVRGTGQIRPK